MGKSPPAPPDQGAAEPGDAAAGKEDPDQLTAEEIEILEEMEMLEILDLLEQIDLYQDPEEELQEVPRPNE